MTPAPPLTRALTLTHTLTLTQVRLDGDDEEPTVKINEEVRFNEVLQLLRSLKGSQ